MARRSRSTGWLKEKWWSIPLAVWLGIFLVLVAGGTLFSIFFVHRKVIEYRPEHTFGIADPAFFGSAHALGDPQPVGGNKIVLLQNGDQIFPALIEAIHSAQKSVNFEAYLFYSGEVGTKFRDALSERARAGVTVRVLLDGLGSGSKLNNSDVKIMTDSGVRFAYYHAARSWRLFRLNRRTHRRILVVDGKLGFTGGVGFADQWRGNGDSPEHWRDIHARIEGPLVAKLQGAFQQHWIKATEEAFGGFGQFPPLQPAGDLRAQVIASHSFSTAPLPLVEAVMFAAAEKRLFITNSYCVPSDDQVALLVAAVKRGVDVRLLVPGDHVDQPATKSAGRQAYGDLLKGGVKIFEYQPGMIHAKTMVADGLFSVFGSSNFDSRSAQINEELDVTVYDEKFGAEMEKIFESDLRHAQAYTLEDFKKRSLWQRFTERLMTPFRSQL